MRSNLTLLLGVLTLGMIAGCATVNPTGDYVRASAHIEAAMGRHVPTPLTRSEETAEDVQALLRDGVTSDESVQIALLCNPNIRSAFAGIGMARADVVQSGLFSNPGLSLAARFPDGGGLANIDAGLGQNIAGLWLIPVRKKAANAELDRQILTVAREVSLIALAARSTYFQTVSAERARQFALENRDLARQLVEIAEARLQAGVGNTIDINLARAGLLNTELELQTTTLAASQAKRDLATLMGFESAPEFELTEPLPDPGEWSLSEVRLISLAQACRLDLQSADRAVRSAAAKVELEQRSVFTNVEVGVSVERDERRAAGNENLAAQTVRDSIRAGSLTIPSLNREPDESQNVITGPSLNLELPLFDQNTAQIAKARYALEQATMNRNALAIEIAQETRSAYDRATTARGVAALYRDELLPLLENNLELSREAYRSGKVSILSVLETQQQLLLSRARYVQSLRESTTAVIDLEKAAGRPLRAILEDGNALSPLSPTGDGATHINLLDQSRKGRG